MTFTAKQWWKFFYDRHPLHSVLGVINMIFIANNLHRNTSVYHVVSPRIQQLEKEEAAKSP